uniref:Activator 1 subunit 5 n=1 Tax=Cyanoderma ruficeps TaxID=181631 RepID=A0A8C3RDP5_9PASS
MEWVGLEGTLKVTLFHPCHGKGQWNGRGFSLSTQVRSQWERSVQPWVPTQEGPGAAGESPEKVTELLPGLEPLCSAARLGELGVLTWRTEGSRDTSEPLPGPKGAPGELERDWGQGLEGQDTGNGFPLPEGRAGWDIGQELFPGRVGRPWHRVPRAAVAVPGPPQPSDGAGMFPPAPSGPPRPAALARLAALSRDFPTWRRRAARTCRGTAGSGGTPGYRDTGITGYRGGNCPGANPPLLSFPGAGWRNTVRRRCPSWCLTGTSSAPCSASSARTGSPICSSMGRPAPGRHPPSWPVPGSCTGSGSSAPWCWRKGFKLVILDEADAMTQDAQNALRRVIEKFTENTRFCLICNYLSKIIPALQSRCTRFRFGPLTPELMVPRLQHVIQEEGVDVSEDGMKALVTLSSGDMRRALNILQSTFMAFGKVTEENVYTCTGHPLKSDIANILDWMLNQDFSTAYRKIMELKTLKGLALQDILTEIHLFMHRVDFPPSIRIQLLIKLADIEYRLAAGTSEKIQLSSLIAAFQVTRDLVVAEA